MNKEKRLIPKLRFPEFNGNDEWKLEFVNTLFDLQDGYAFSSKVFTSSPENGRQVVRITDINNQNKNSEKVFIPEEKVEGLGIDAYSVTNGDLLLSLTGAAGFNFYIWENGTAFINQRTMKITPKNSKNESLKVLLSPLIHKKINGIGTGQNNNLSKDALKAIEFPVPQPQEQQKIASCLSSLDELIAAHNDKLDTLKDHKKGLLQNLFPQEGETEPKVRFPEFEGNGEWVENQLQEHCHNISSGKNKNQDDGEIDLYGSTGIIGKTENESYEGDYILVARVGANAGLLNRAIGKFGVTDNTLIINIKEPEMVDFIFYSLDKIGLNKLVFGSGQPLVTGKQLKELYIPIPKNPKEQQKIASCLSAVDELITAQQEKIEELQQHKKGLMQGLFPKITN